VEQPQRLPPLPIQETDPGVRVPEDRRKTAGRITRMMTIHSQVRFLDDICGLEQAASGCRQTATGLAPERRHRWHSQLGRLGASDSRP
jgi:hypothetical protein